MIYTPYFALYWGINHTPTPYIPLASPEKATEAPCLRRSVSWIGLASSETDMVFSSAIIGKNDWHEISQIWWRTEISASDCVWDRKLTPRAETRREPYWAYFVLEDQSKVCWREECGGICIIFLQILSHGSQPPPYVVISIITCQPGDCWTK